MLLSIMDGAELELNNTLLPSSSTSTPKTTTTTNSTSEDYEKDLQLAAELGRCLLERNQELQAYIGVLQKQIDDERNDIKLLHIKLESTREQLDNKCKQTELLDATNFDLERELIQQRRDTERDRQRIKELTELYDKTRKQYQDLEHDFEVYRSKQYTNQFFPKQFSSPVQNSNISRRSRSHSIDSKSVLLNTSSSSSTPSTPLNSDFSSSSSVFKTHLIDLKSRLHSLTNDYSSLNEKYHQSESEKRQLNDRLIQLERQRRDENDSYQTELNSYQKLLDKHQNEPNRDLFSTMYSPPEHDLSLYDEVLFEHKIQSNTKTLSSYEPTNYKDLFARVYDKLKPNVNQKS